MRVFILQGEVLDPTATGNPPACFRPREWAGYCDMVTRIGFRVAGEQPGPSRRPKYLSRDSFDALRQARALREQACADCTIAYQVAQRVQGRCHPVNFDRTPIGRALVGDDPAVDVQERRGDIIARMSGKTDWTEPDADEVQPVGRPLGGDTDPERRRQWREYKRRSREQQMGAGL